VLGAVIEKVSGKSLDVYLRETIWNPLRMNDTGFQVPESNKPRLAYAFNLNPLDNKPQSIPPLEPGITFECGGSCSLSSRWAS
jgi:CubicO group peptidase (beta-lactamase class C family)